MQPESALEHGGAVSRDDSHQRHSGRAVTGLNLRETHARAGDQADTGSTVRDSLTGYNRVMSRVTKTVTAAAVALAVAAFPAVLDRCAATCEAHQEAITSAPSCHHATSTAARIGQVPTPCGHDHNATAMTSAKSDAPVGRAIGSVVAAGAIPNPFTPAGSDRRVLRQAPPGSSPAVDGRSLPLRI